MHNLRLRHPSWFWWYQRRRLYIRTITPSTDYHRDITTHPHPIARQMAEECNERNSRDGFTMYKVDGEYCFEGLRVGPKVKIPSKDELLALLGDQPVNAATIRNITYTLIREELARLYGTTVQEAADIIGNQLDCAPHEDISGYIFMVPNWAHKWFRHNGYVSRMLK